MGKTFKHNDDHSRSKKFKFKNRRDKRRGTNWMTDPKGSKAKEPEHRYEGYDPVFPDYIRKF